MPITEPTNIINITNPSEVKFQANAFIEGIVKNTWLTKSQYGDEIINSAIYIEKTNYDKKIIMILRLSSSNPNVIQDFLDKGKTGTHIQLSGKIKTYKNNTGIGYYQTIEPKKVLFGNIIPEFVEIFKNFDEEKASQHNKIENELFNKTNSNDVIEY